MSNAHHLRAAGAALVLALGLPCAANAASILVVGGLINGPQYGTGQAFAAAEAAEGNTVTFAATSPPTDVTGYVQVWDLAFDNTLSAATQSLYLDYLAGGGKLFLMGENYVWQDRDVSMADFGEAAGGGSLPTTGPGSSQTLSPAFATPVPLTTVDLIAPGGLYTPGNGQFITSNASGGSGVAFAPGTLTNAPAGKLVLFFDSTFLDGGGANDALERDLIHYMGDGDGPVRCDGPCGLTGVTSAAPEPASWALMLSGFGLAGAILRRRRSGSLRGAA